LRFGFGFGAAFEVAKLVMKSAKAKELARKSLAKGTVPA